MEICIENMVVDEGDEMILPMSVEYRNDITEDDLIVLCRLCGNCSNQLMPIFTGDGAEHRLPEKIEEHLPIIKVSRDDLLPLNICYQCASTLISWHELYHACKEADQRLRDICLKLQLRAEKSDDTFVEVQDHFAENDALDSSEENNDFDKRSKNLEVNHSPSDSHSVMDPATSCAVTEKTTDIGSEDVDVTKTSVENDRSNRSNQYVHVDVESSSSSTLAPASNSPFVAEDDLRIEHTVSEYELEQELECDREEVEVDLFCVSKRGDERENMSNERLAKSVSPTVDQAVVDEASSFRAPASCSSTNDAVDYDRFVVVYSNGIKYMQCDRCTFICRPLISVFSNHYRSHADTGTSAAAAAASEHPRWSPDTAEERHQRVAGNSRTSFRCAVCGKLLADEAALTNHAKCHEPRVFACKLCGLKFRTKFELQSHRQTHPVRSSVPIRCNFCGKDFKTKSGYNHHRANVCVKYRCDLCGELFLVKTLFLDHSRKVHNVEVVDLLSGQPQKREPAAASVCPVCGKSISENAMSRHLQLHTEEKPYVCDLCGKQFRVKWSLREHIMVEIGMKDYVCEICGKKFVIQAYLNKHMRFHLMSDGKLEGYQCEMCGKKYAEEWRVKEHQRNSHQNRQPRKYKCDVCDKKYSRKWLVRSHKRVAHKEFFDDEFQCEHCDKKFVEKWMIKLHLQTLHNVRFRQQRERQIEDGQTAAAAAAAVVVGTTDELEKLLEYNNAIKNELTAAAAGAAATTTTTTTTITSDAVSGEEKDEQQRAAPRKSFECELCKKTFATKQGMKNHLYAELNLRKYACDVCGKRYNWWMGLKEHSIMSHGEKEFVCSVCEKDFPTKKRYQDHMSVHSDRRPYECDCGNSFKLRRYLAKHQKRSCKIFKAND